MNALAAIAAGGIMLLWPALLNGYPLLFSDTGAFLHQTQGPLMIWDKPWIYGPVLHLLHWRISLWGPAVAQAVALSWLLWLAQRQARGAVSPAAHLGLVLLLAAGTAAPWFAALLMPDILAPMVVLGLYLLSGSGLGRAERLGVMLLATLAIASHLAHLPLAAALVLLLALMRRGGWRPVKPLALALLLVLLGNMVGHRVLAVSPYGATFLLARLQADGPATRTLQAACPDAGWDLCQAVQRLPMDSDIFLWSPSSPLNQDASGRQRYFGAVALAPEARAIVAATLVREPWGVARAMLLNTWRQLGLTRVGDTLVNDNLGIVVTPRVAEGFPAAEQLRYAEALQPQGKLEAAARGWLRPHGWVLMLGALAALLALRRALAWRDGEKLALMLCVLLGLAANAFATGALSGPHDRYQARIAWLLPLAALLCRLPTRPDGTVRHVN